MYFKTIIAVATAVLFAGQAMGAAMIATNPCAFPSTSLKSNDLLLIFLSVADSACNCPNNCNHREGTSCRFYAGPSDNSPVLKGRE